MKIQQLNFANVELVTHRIAVGNLKVSATAGGHLTVLAGLNNLY